jgi:hypothetical protein
MFFKVEKSGCSERKGLVQVRYDLYLEEADDRYSEHYVQVPVIPEGGYKGDVDERGRPKDPVDYQNWLDGLDKIWRVNSFCCHFCQFEPDVTDEEILFVGELALDMAYKNWQEGDLSKNINQPIIFSDDIQKKTDCDTRVADILTTDYATVATVGNYKVR